MSFTKYIYEIKFENCLPLSWTLTVELLFFQFISGSFVCRCNFETSPAQL
jgi:hypothetical protein